MLSTLPIVSCGVDSIQGSGVLETSNIMSLEQVVVEDEIARVCQRLRDGVDTSPDKDYLDDIANVGPGGQFLGQRNTLDLARSEEFMVPVLVARKPFNCWGTLGAAWFV